MFRWMRNKARYARLHAKKNKTAMNGQQAPSKPEPAEEELPPDAVYTSLEKNEAYVRTSLGKHDGILFRAFQAGQGSNRRRVLLVAVSSIVEKALLNDNVIKPIMQSELSNKGGSAIAYLQESVLSVTDIEECGNLQQAVERILQGNAALFIEGEQSALLINAGIWKQRNIEQPLSETVIRGPRDSFVEDLQTNLSLVRKRIFDPQLRLETMTVGTMTQTKVVIVYLDGVVNASIVEEVKTRISKIKVDTLLETGYIEQYIEDAPFSLFPTIANTEKPDIASARILEGRVAIFVDGTPIVLTVPDLLISHFQVSEDYYNRPIYASLFRLLRILSFLTTIMLPGLFVAIQYYHPVLIPYSLLVSLAEAREGVPFQLYIELILMILVFEVIREAGVRMPRPIGQAISIVGAIILGQAAVEAGLVGLPVVVVVAFAGISTFLIYSLVEPISVLRLLFALAGATFGVYGILLLGMVVVTHLASIRSFGVPYAAPLFPLVWSDWKDAILRFPLPMLRQRPKSLDPVNKIRQKEGGVTSEDKRKQD